MINFKINLRKISYEKGFLIIRRIFLFLPLLLFTGQRSLIAYDEGFYALQAKWILENNNWIVPVWWDKIVLDRTIGLQALIAISQKFFGETIFSIFIPSLISGIFMLILTYELHKELINRKYALISPLIMSTTYLWINYFHMATQDIIFSSFITLGILACIKSLKTKANQYYFLAGIWIGIAFMFKTYLVVIPFLSILPFLYLSKIYKNSFFWIGLIVGFFPFTIWSIQVNSIYGYEEWKGLFSKLVTLSKENNFTNPFYYYLWNFPLNTLPWSIFSFIGFFRSLFSKEKLSNYFLFKYPLLLIILLSLFSTKTPYYPLQILSLFSLNAFIGINYIFNKKNLFTKLFKKIVFIFLPLVIMLFLIFLKLDNSLIFIDNKLKNIIFCGLFLLAISWLISTNLKNYKNRLIFICLGPYLFFSLGIQAGILNDRSKELRIESQTAIKQEKLSDKKIEVITSGEWDEESTSKIIRISLLMPKIGNGVENLDDLNTNQSAWTNYPREEILKKSNFKILYESRILEPWKLIIKSD